MDYYNSDDDEDTVMFSDPGLTQSKRYGGSPKRCCSWCCENKVLCCTGCCSVFGTIFILTMAAVLFGAFGVVPPLGDEGLNSEFDLFAAKRLAKWSSVAYCPKEDIPSWSCGSCDGNVTNTTVVTNPYQGGVQVVVGVDHGIDKGAPFGVVVSFRGTQALENWITDFDMKQVPPESYLLRNGQNPDNIQVHQGYQTAYSKVRTQLREAVAKLCDFDYRIHVTGHSLGASVGIICAYDFSLNPVCNNNTRKGQTITFGAIRTGNVAFATTYNTTLDASGMDSWRVVHYADTAAAFIPRKLDIVGGPYTYHHIGREVWFSEDNSKYTVCDGSGEDPRCSMSIPGVAQRILDHQVYMGEVIFPCGSKTWVPTIEALISVFGGLTMCIIALFVFRFCRYRRRRRTRGVTFVSLNPHG
eukprot:m.78192 g.78192  ORF g.78192 m.78192 type:complete len:413 (+) comp25091_c0_seq1:299-1537(+)